MSVGTYFAPPEHPSVRDAREEQQRREQADRDARSFAEGERQRAEERERREERDRDYRTLDPAVESDAIASLTAHRKAHEAEVARANAAVERARSVVRSAEREQAALKDELARLRQEAAAEEIESDKPIPKKTAEARAAAIDQARAAVTAASDRVEDLAAHARTVEEAAARVTSGLDLDAHRHDVQRHQARLARAIEKQLLEESSLREVLIECLTARSLAGNGVPWDRLLRELLEPPDTQALSAARSRLLEQYPALDGTLR